MITDRLLKFSNKQAVTSSAAGTTVIDNKAAGDSEPQLYFVVDCDVTATSSGAATLTVELQTSDYPTFVDGSNNPSYKTLAKSDTIALADITAGKRLFAGRFANGAKRYMRAYYTVGTANLTAGKFTAYLTMDLQTNG